MWIVDCEFNELASEWHGVDWTSATRDEVLDLIVVSLRLLIDHMNFEELLDE